MKKNNGFLKRRIIAIALSVITLSSFATMSLTTASAATSPQTISAVVNKNTVNLLKGSTTAEKQALKDIKEIKRFVDDYKQKSTQEAKDAKISKRKDKVAGYATKAIETVDNIVKGEYVGAVKNVVSLFPYGGVITSVIDLISSIFSPVEEKEVVPEVSLEDIKKQLKNMDESIKSLEKAVEKNKNSEFYKCLNQIALVYNNKGSVITQYIKDKSELVKAKKKLDTATQEKDTAKIEEAQKDVAKAKKEFKASKKLMYNFFGDKNINDFYKLQKSLKQCTQYMSGMTAKSDSDQEENPFMINFNSKKAGASTGTPVDSIIEECIKDNEEIWKYYELGITMYSILAPSYVSYLNTREKKDMANANKQEYISFMTGIYPSKGEEKPYNSVNAIDVHDYYMNSVLPKMLEESGKYKFEDNSWGEKVAEVTCNGETEMFKSFEEAWNYARQYTNTKITVFKDFELENIYETSNQITNNIELDFQGHKIISYTNYYGFRTSEDSKGKLTIKNGTFVKGIELKIPSGSAKIENCIFRHRYNTLIISKSHLEMSNCIFENNASVYKSSLIRIEGGTSKFENCVFKNNQSKGNGGVIFYEYGLPTQKINNCTFTNNYAGNNGGAVYVSEHTDIDISNSTFTENKCDNNGGAIYLGQLTSTNHYFRNVTIENNKCRNEGGGVYANACGCNTADIKLFGWNKIRYNTDVCGAASNAKMIKDTCRTVFKIMDDFDPYNSDIRGTTNSDGSCMVFLNSSSSYTYYYNYPIQSGAFKADYGKLEQSGSGVYWYK
ncbi:MAG: hypothetical protein ACI4F2_01325 [Acutalibacteraceae bacterium]